MIHGQRRYTRTLNLGSPRGQVYRSSGAIRLEPQPIILESAN